MEKGLVLLARNELAIHASKILQNIWETRDFSDVTLVSADLHKIEAHKFMLSECSPLLKHILENNSFTNTLIYLKGIQSDMLLKILEFAYRGECEVGREDLGLLLEIGTELQVNGLVSECKLENEKTLPDEPLSDTENMFNLSDKLELISPEINDHSYVSGEYSSEKGNQELNMPNNFHEKQILMTKKIELFQGELNEPFKSDLVNEYKSENEIKELSNSHFSTEKQCNLTNQINNVNPEINKSLILDNIISSVNVEYNDDAKVWFPCNICDFISKSRRFLKAHKESTHDGISFKCDQCKYVASFKRNLITHQQAVHNKDNGRDNICDKCDYKSSVKNLKMHKDSKHNGIRHSCDQCDYTAVQAGSIKIHKDSVHEGLNYKCEICKFTTKWSGDLKRHSLSHESLKINCDKCNYQTIKEAKMEGHQTSKHGNIKVEELVVKKEPSDRKKRIKRRKSETPLTCDQCHYKSQWGEAHLKRHKLNQHNDTRTVITCSKCNYRTKDNVKLEQHKMVKHDTSENIN